MHFVLFLNEAVAFAKLTRWASIRKWLATYQTGPWMNYKQKYFSYSIRQFRLPVWKPGRCPKGKQWLCTSFWSVNLHSCSELWQCHRVCVLPDFAVSLGLWTFGKAACSLNKAEYLSGHLRVVGKRVRTSLLSASGRQGPEDTVCTSLQQCECLGACFALAGCPTVQNCSDPGDHIIELNWTRQRGWCTLSSPLLPV